MNTCTEHKGAVVVYEGWSCPLCRATSKVDELEKTIQEREEQIRGLEDEVGEMLGSVSSIKAALQPKL